MPALHTPAPGSAAALASDILAAAIVALLVAAVFAGWHVIVEIAFATGR